MPPQFESISFRNASRAREDLAGLGGSIPEAILTRMQVLLASVPDPDEAVHHLERFRRESPAAFDRVASSPAALQYLITIFSYSRFLSEAVLRYPEAVLQLAVAGNLYRVLSCEEFGERLAEFLGPQAEGVP